MAIHEAKEIQSVTGFKKEIDAAGLTMVMDNLQVYQYQYPQKSVIREVTSNAKDAVKEKQIAVKILKGQAKVEDFYIYREEDVYKSSNFDSSYFDLNWLDLNNDEVLIEHRYGQGLEAKDVLTIRDNGVGLGGKRLEGYFKLSWSSKRNSKDALGKFGIGAKAPLSLGINSYRMVSYYNGCKFIFDVYAHKVDSAVSRFNLSTGEENPSYIFENGFVAYYEPTTHKNGTEIIIETKKHHRALYIDAVKSQLLHFENVTFKTIDEYGYATVHPVLTSIIYEDDYIVLSNNTQFSKPYLLIGNPGSMVSYGYVDFQELELENKVGNIGIKVSSESVTVNPSRESVIWDERTRDTIVSRFKKVVDIAQDVVTKSLQETDIVEWMSKAKSVLMGHGGDVVLDRLSRVVDKSSITPVYPVDKSIKFTTPSKFFDRFTIRVIQRLPKGTKSNKVKIDRNNMESWNSFNKDYFYYTTGSASYKKDMFICSNISSSNYETPKFTLLTLPNEESEKAILDSYDLTDPEQKKLHDGLLALQASRAPMIKYIKESKYAIDYDAIEVPDTFMKDVEETDEETTEVEAIIESDKERRRREQKILTLVPSGDLKYLYVTDKSIAWTRCEYTVDHLENFTGTMVYGHSEDDELLHFVINILLSGPYNTYSLSDDILVLKVAKTAVKHLTNGIHVKDFICTFKDKIMSTHNELVKWNTARILSQDLHKLEYLKNFGLFNIEKTQTYGEVLDYCERNYRVPLNSSVSNGYGMNRQVYTDFLTQLDSITELQLFIENNKEDSDAILAKSTSLFKADVGTATAIDLDMYNKMQDLLEYSTDIYVLLNTCRPLTIGGIISPELESEIKSYMSFKGAEIAG